MRYLTINEVLLIHSALIEAYGGSHGVRDKGLVESSLLRPQTGYYQDLLEEAAALWESLAMNHGFIDGNKRIAFAVVDIFLDLNGVNIAATQDMAEALIYRHLEAGTFTKDNLDAWLRSHTETA